MAQLVYKLSTMNKALKSLESSIDLYEEYKKKYEQNSTLENEKIFLGMRDSVIQRFEYCTDLFWKLLKLYLEEVEKIDVVTFSPRGVIRETAKTKFISEKQAKICMDMITNRNETSHIYHEEVAQEIVDSIPTFYHLMHALINKMSDK